MLTVLKDRYKTDSSAHWMIDLRCDCGELETRRYSHYKNRKKDCCRVCSRKKHSMAGTKFYAIWNAVRTRATNKNIAYAKNYVDRGIDISDSWLNFENFYTDMFGTYQENLSIDRIDNDKGYSKENCRWASRYTQQANTRVKNKTGFIGVSKSGRARFTSKIKVNSKIVHIGSFDTAEEASLARDIYIVKNGIDAPTLLSEEKIRQIIGDE